MCVYVCARVLGIYLYLPYINSALLCVHTATTAARYEHTDTNTLRALALGWARR